MKKILAMAAAAALAAGVSVSAANPFSDVSESDWAYQAISELSDQGLVIGYPDGTFRGQSNITRYEAAQIVARLMAHVDQYNAEQRALVNRLAEEFADELDSLGVRVSNLEKKVGNLSWSGDARMRYQSNDATDSDEAWRARVRVSVKGQVNERTTVNARFSTDNVDLKESADADVTMEAFNVAHDFGAWDLKLGRYGLALGNQQGWLYNSSFGVDGLEANTNLGVVSLKLGFAQFNSNKSQNSAIDNQDTFYAMAGAKLDAFDVYVNYLSNAEGTPSADYEIWGVGLNVPVGDFRVFGEYWENTDAASNVADDAWNIGVGYGKRDLKKVGSYSVDLSYMNVGTGMYLGGTGWQTDMLTTVQYGKQLYDEVDFWNLLAEVVVMPNVYIHGEYAFASDAKGGAGDPDDTWTLSLNYVF